MCAILSAASGTLIAFCSSVDLRRRVKSAIALLLACCLPILSASSRARAMDFRWVAPGNSSNCFGGLCGTSITAEGEITDATPADFRAFLGANAPAHRGRIVVFIDSPGGKIVAGIELGKIFRQLGVTASVARTGDSEQGSALTGGICFSACVYALMGATRRIAPHDSKIGVHRMFAYDGGARRYDDGQMAAMLRRYSNMMGVSPELIAATEQGTSDAIRILTPAEIARWRLASPGS